MKEQGALCRGSSEALGTFFKGEEGLFSIK